MTSLEIVCLVIGVAAGVGMAVIFLLPLLKKKGVKTQDILQKADTSLTATDTVIGVADKILPGNPAIAILKLIDSAAHKGVTQAEQMCIASQLQENERNAKAKETIWTILGYAGIKETPELDKIVDGTIESEVLALGHKEPSDSEKAAQLQQVQQNVTSLQQENIQLKQKLQTIQSAAK